jgi:hypothetical protein
MDDRMAEQALRIEILSAMTLGAKANPERVQLLKGAFAVAIKTHFTANGRTADTISEVMRALALTEVELTKTCLGRERV